LIAFINKMAGLGMISPHDVDLIFATDSIEQAIEHIRAKAIEPFGLRLITRVRRHLPWLGEKALAQK
jgi:predicted Rossmann-fold nucleotide-binding protein